MHCRLLIVLALFAKLTAMELANPGFETGSNQPDGWRPYAWGRERADEKVTLAGEAAAGTRCLRLAAVDAGSLGVASSSIDLGGEAVPLRVRLRLRASPDYAGNRPWLFLSCQGKDAFLGAVNLAPLPTLQPGTWQEFEVTIPAEQLKPGTLSMCLNLATQVIPGSVACTGHLDFDEVSISEDLSAPPVTLTCDRYAQWAVLGQPVAFTIASGTLPGSTRAIRVVATDTAGKTVVEQAVAGADFAAAGWRWTPSSPGFYEIAFTWEGERGGRPVRVPLTASYTTRTKSGATQTWPRERWSVAVSATPARPLAERPAQFGFSYMLEGETSMRLADLIGMSFCRVHAIPWGAQFADASWAIEAERGVYNWERFDKEMEALKRYGFPLVGNVNYTPRWASPHPEETQIDICVLRYSAYAPTDVADLSRFLKALVARYGERFFAWELYNEPHLPGGSCFWNDTPERFVELMHAGYTALREVQPKAEVWIGGIGMRYLPFYRAYLRAGGAPWMTHLALHGKWCDAAPFRRLERAAKVPSKPWVVSEQHGILLNPNDNLASEAALSRRLVLDSLSLLAKGAERTALFTMTEYKNKELLEPARLSGEFIHSSGLFRTRPRLEPRLPALVWQTVLAQFRKGLTFRAERRAGAIRALDLDNAGSRLLVVWHDEQDPVAVPPALAASAATAIDWEGRQVGPRWIALAPEVIYLVRDATPALCESLPPGDALPRQRNGRPVLNPPPKATAIWGRLPDAPPLIEATSYQRGATPEAVRARFAVAADAIGFELLVEVQDPEHVSNDEPGAYYKGDSLQFALDTAGLEGLGDEMAFQFALTAAGPVLWKHVAPNLGGDLPNGYTPAKRVVANGKAEVERIPGGLRYHLRLPISELYPLVPDRDLPLRFSLLVNSNRGQGRAGWVEWASGIGGEVNPAEYGMLDWAK